MNILVLNGGSSSHKLCLYRIANELPLHPPKPRWEAQIDWYPQRQEAVVEISTEKGEPHEETQTVTDRQKTLTAVIKTLWQGPSAMLAGEADIDVVGHRVVHGGQTYQQSVVIEPAVKAEIDRLSELAPVHNPVNLEGIELMEQLLDSVPQIAVFDTAFHSQMPIVAQTYPGPYHWFEQGIRRYGFHGISHEYCAHRAAQILDRPLESLRLVICHLGNGGSLSAVKQGHSIDTTMGFTPLDGLMMGTRSGAVDPGILIYLMRRGYSADQIDQMLNRESGLKGISGVSNDLREIRQATAEGNERAQLAQDLYLHRLKSCIGSMVMGLEGMDALVFTAGIGEHNPQLRAATCKSMAFLGVRVDAAKNKVASTDEDISSADSAVRILVIHTQEDWAIAQHCWRGLKLRSHASQS
ncbi:MAG: acetate kinase [Cyanobacteria bacterium J06648_16]